MATKLELLIVSGGHDFDRPAFDDMFAAMDGIEVTHLSHPEARDELISNGRDYDCVFFYDMCGIPGARLAHDGADAEGNPDPTYARAIEQLLQSGTGLLLANHATVSWPSWPLWRQISGTSFQLRATTVDGEQVPGSGYRGGHGPLPNPTVRLTPHCDHPVLAGLEDGFEITDELYLKTAGFEAQVLPLLRADYDFVMENFSPPPQA